MACVGRRGEGNWKIMVRHAKLKWCYNMEINVKKNEEKKAMHVKRSDGLQCIQLQFYIFDSRHIVNLMLTSLSSSYSPWSSTYRFMIFQFNQQFSSCFYFLFIHNISNFPDQLYIFAYSLLNKQPQTIFSKIVDQNMFSKYIINGFFSLKK